MMQNTFIKFFKSNSEISDFLSHSAHLENPKTRRSAIRIAVIDDEPFAPQTNLQSYGYSITPIGDLKNLEEIEKYSIILCDIMGVGRHFDAKLQGASLIAEIKNNYPEKIVIAYTGAALSEKAVRLAKERADAIIKKDIDIEDWINELDKLSIIAVDPYRIWNRIRNRLIELNVDTKDILILEDSYVRSIQSKDENFSRMQHLISNYDIRKDARAIVQGLAANLIFKIIFNG